MTMKRLSDFIKESIDIVEAEEEKKEEKDDSNDNGTDEKTTERADIKFTIWKEPDVKVDWLEKYDPYQKIEYIYNDKEKNITIDFLLGFKDNKWQLWAGKDGAIGYDDDPFVNLKERRFDKAIVAALDKVQEIIQDVKDNPDNWPQFYINNGK